jgi:hypothetical protein
MGELRYTVPAAVTCTASVCVHWVENDANAPTGSDGDPATVPDGVSTTLATVDSVYVTQTQTLGYRAPLADTAARTTAGIAGWTSTWPTSAVRASSATASSTTTSRPPSSVRRTRRCRTCR